MNIVKHHVILNGEKQGPFTIGQLRRMWEAGQVNLQTQHFMDGYTEWMPLEYILEDLEPKPATAPPAHPMLVQQGYHHPAPMVMVVPKSRGAYIVLGLFLGGLGIHNFYAGYYGTAVAQLLITLLTGWLLFPLLLVGIWVLVEVIAKESDANGLRMR